MKTLLLIDGNAIMHRAYHALPPFKTKSGQPTNALFGFLSMLYKATVDFNPQYLVVCFDTPTPTFRKKIFEEYQAHRPKIEDDLKTQFTPVKEALDAAGVVHLEKPGFEADDLIGTISHHFDKNGIKVLILSGDRDIIQLVGNNVYVITPQIGFAKTKIYNEEEVEKKFGVTASQIPDYKALAGDQSDNYKGAKGIGPKTAAKLISQFKSVENLFKQLPKVEPKLKTVLKENKKNILLSKKLATILTNVDIDFQIDKTAFSTFYESLKEILIKYEIRSLVNRFFGAKNVVVPKKEPEKKKDDKSQMGLF